MNHSFLTQTNLPITLDQQLGAGGEGEVWSIKERLDVAKLYHSDSIKPEQEFKVLAMIANPPEDRMRLKGHISIAWPTDALYAKGKFSGFLMPRIERSPTIFAMYNPKIRQRDFPGFTWKYLMHTALNLAIAIDAIHRKGYVVGDLNESNVLVTPTALVSIIDTDSFQVRDNSGKIYICRVGKEDFLPPEIQGADLSKLERLQEHDHYSLAVLIFRLLMEGIHPFTGILKREIELGESTQYYCQKNGVFPYDPKNKTVSPPIIAPDYAILPSKIQNLFNRCFIAGHRQPNLRPSAADWIGCLEEAENNLSICTKTPLHVFSNHLPNCPWCEKETTKYVDRLQTPLPSAASSTSKAKNPAPAVTKQNTPSAQPGPLPPQKLPPRQPAVPATKPWQAPSKKITSQPVRRGFFISARQHLDLKIWSRSIWKYSLAGLAGGALLSWLIYLIFRYQTAAGYAAGVIGALLTGVVGFLSARFLNKKPNQFIQIFSLLTMLIFVGLAILSFIEISKLTKNYLGGFLPNMYWVAAESLFAGLVWGTAYGSHKVVQTRKSQALAWASTIFLAAIPVCIFLLLSQWDIP